MTLNKGLKVLKFYFVSNGYANIDLSTVIEEIN